jgi:hypothetical protein
VVAEEEHGLEEEMKKCQELEECDSVSCRKQEWQEK